MRIEACTIEAAPITRVLIDGAECKVLKWADTDNLEYGTFDKPGIVSAHKAACIEIFADEIRITTKGNQMEEFMKDVDSVRLYGGGRGDGGKGKPTLEQIVAGAIYQFAARLTSLKTTIKTGGNEPVYAVVEQVDQFLSDCAMGRYGEPDRNWREHMNDTDAEVAQLKQHAEELGKTASHWEESALTWKERYVQTLEPQSAHDERFNKPRVTDVMKTVQCVRGVLSDSAWRELLERARCPRAIRDDAIALNWDVVMFTPEPTALLSPEARLTFAREREAKK